MEGIGEARQHPKVGLAGTKPKGGEAMKLREKSMQEILTLAYYKASRQGKREVSVFIPLPYLPPCEPYRVVEVEEKFGKVKVFVRTAKQGGWVATVRFPREVFNPVLPEEKGRELLEKLQK
jgi:hypothetical protein